MTLHHQIPESRGGRNGDNKREWEDEKHTAYHTLFENSLPHEAMAMLLFVHWKCLTDEVRDSLADILIQDASEIYRKELYKAKQINEIPENIRRLIQRLLPEVDNPKQE